MNSVSCPGPGAARRFAACRAAARAGNAIALTTFLIATQSADAHPVVEGIGGLQGGLLHPLMVPAHLMTLVALGLLAGQQSNRHRRGLMALLAVSLMAGLILVVAAFSPAHQDDVVLAVAAAAGILVAIARPLPAAISVPLIAIAGAALELDSVPQDISMLTAFLALTGTGAAASTVALTVAETTARLRRDWQRIGVRVVGSWIAAGAILAVVLRLAR
jgi:hydrogenase/urease accessory protein HupE